MNSSNTQFPGHVSIIALFPVLRGGSRLIRVTSIRFQYFAVRQSHSPAVGPPVLCAHLYHGSLDGLPEGEFSTDTWCCSSAVLSFLGGTVLQLVLQLLSVRAAFWNCVGLGADPAGLENQAI